MTTIYLSAERELANLLRVCRTRIGHHCTTLGSFSRLPARIGRPVSQEEVAEAAGITRQWYARMESRCQRRFSPRLLARIADVLMLDGSEREVLMRLAMPELYWR